MISLLFLLSLAALKALGQSSSSSASGVQPLAAAISSIFPPGATLTPQILKTFLEPNDVVLRRNSYVYREGTTLKLQGKPWTASGANVYWLGLDENVVPPAGAPYYAPLQASYPTHGRITEAMATLVTMGARTIRSQTLGVSVGNPLSLMPSLGVYNEQAFDSMDWAVFQARQHGLRIIPPLVDDYDYYHGGKFTFLRWRGYNITGSAKPLPADTMKFYTDPTIVQDFKSYIEHLMTHLNPYTGLTYAEDPTIVAYETGNELKGIVWGDQDVPNDWTREICQLIKKLGPKKLCVDGTYGINSTHFAVSEVDIFSNHYYPLNITLLKSDIDSVEKADRVYIAGELGWSDTRGDSLAGFLDVILRRQKVAAGSMFWSLFGRNVPDCSKFVDHSDGFTLHYNNPNNSATIDGLISTIRQHYFAMQNITVDSYLPSVPCPRNYIPGYDTSYYM